MAERLGIRREPASRQAYMAEGKGFEPLGDAGPRRNDAPLPSASGRPLLAAEYHALEGIVGSRARGYARGAAVGEARS